jgi:hypothetical protein
LVVVVVHVVDADDDGRSGECSDKEAPWMPHWPPIVRLVRMVIIMVVAVVRVATVVIRRAVVRIWRIPRACVYIYIDVYVCAVVDVDVVDFVVVANIGLVLGVVHLCAACGCG